MNDIGQAQLMVVTGQARFVQFVASQDDPDGQGECHHESHQSDHSEPPQPDRFGGLRCRIGCRDLRARRPLFLDRRSTRPGPCNYLTFGELRANETSAILHPNGVPVRLLPFRWLWWLSLVGVGNIHSQMIYTR